MKWVVLSNFYVARLLPKFFSYGQPWPLFKLTIAKHFTNSTTTEVLAITKACPRLVD